VTTGAAAHNLDEEVRDDLFSLDLGINEARDLAQNWPLCHKPGGRRQTDVFAQHYAVIVLHATVGLVNVESFYIYQLRLYRILTLTMLVIFLGGGIF